MDHRTGPAVLPVTPAYSDSGVTIYQGHCLELLSLLPPQSVNCVVTSPPYWGLRDYGTGRWEGGSDLNCLHKVRNSLTPAANSTLGDGKKTVGHQHEGYECFCPRCGATRIDFQLGLESTPEEYVSRMVEVFDAVWNVLRDDGTLWLNMGDSSAADGGLKHGAQKIPYDRGEAERPVKRRVPKNGVLKAKDIVGMPWRIALALQMSGWYLRADIIWHKPNPMPESVKDRPTKSHEYIFLLSKSERYFYDWKAIAERVTGGAHSRGNGINPKAAKWPAGWASGTGCAHDELIGRYRPKQNESFSAAIKDPLDVRNKRSVWTIPTEAFPGAHFATFPRALPRTCILAGCPAGGMVLDPFCGSGTTLEVAKTLGCEAIGLELNPEYVKLSEKRLGQSVFDLVYSEEKGGRAGSL